MSRPRIFISYSSKDRRIVEKAHNILINHCNFDVWRDQTRLRTDWSQEIAYALAESDVLCLMWSKSSAASKWVKNEWLTARALEKRIIPILFPNAPKLPEPLHNLHSVHLEERDPNGACQEVGNRIRENESYIERYDYKVLPANSYIPFNPNPNFTGRHVDLLELYLKMIGNLNKIGINQVGAVGMGGVGKTQLAVEFAYRFSFAFDSVHWIQAANKEQCRTQLVKLARIGLGLSIPSPESEDADNQYIHGLHKYCKDNPQTLIIMDNVIDPKTLNNDTYLDGLTPLSLGCNLLFTTRQHFRLNSVTSQAVDVLSLESAYLLLIHDRKPSTLEEDDHARAICNAVGYLPLAIILAAGYLNEYIDVSFSEYQAELIRNKLDVIDIGELTEEELATRHRTSVGVTLQEDWKRITDENTRLLFQLAGQFEEAEIISKARLGLMAGITSDKSKLHRPLDKSINLLHSLSLAEKMESDSRAVRLHPLVREFALRTVSENEQIKFRSNAAKNLQSAYFDYTRLERELIARGVGEVLDDMQIAINWWGKDAQVLQELNLLHSSLCLSYNQLDCDPNQLAPHLIGRLNDINTHGIKRLLSSARKNQKGVWFNPICCCLTPPGGPLLRTFEGHSKDVWAVAISPDGKTAISGSRDYTLKLWDLSTGRTLHTLIGHSDRVTAVAISPDGKTAVSGSYDTTLKLWDLSTSQTLRTIDYHRGVVTAVAISPDGKIVVSASVQESPMVWDLSSGQVLHTLEGHSDLVTAVAISPDGKTIISGSSDDTLRLWNLLNGQTIRTFEGHSDVVTAVAISSDGKTIISGSSDYTLKLWDLFTGQTIRTFDGHKGVVTAVAISPDGETMVSGSYDETFRVWDLSSGQTLRTLDGHSDVVRAVAISQNGKTAVSGSDDTTLKLWDLASGKAVHTPVFHNGWINVVAISPDGSTAVSGSDDTTLKLWDLASGKAIYTLEGHTSPIESLAISPDSKTAVSGSNDTTLKVWKLASGRVLHSLEGHEDDITAVAISPDSRTVVSGSDDETLRVWNLSSGKALYTLRGHRGYVFSVAISPDGKTAISGSYDKTLKLWDLANGLELRTLEGHSENVKFVAISPDGKTAISGSDDETLKVWDLFSGKAIHTLRSHSGGFNALAISPDGKTAISCSWNMDLKLWDLSTGRALLTFAGHSGEVNAVAISPDGKTAISGSDDKTLKMWDLFSGQVIANFVGESGISCLAISSSGRVVLAGGESGYIHLLQLEGF